MSRTNPYSKTNWTDEETEISAYNLNKMEQGIYAAHNAVIAVEDTLAETTDNLLETNTVDTVKKAVADSLGRVIDTTYTTKTYVDNANTLNVKHSDVVNSLTDTSTINPLSAAQGKELKRQIDELYAFLDTATEDVDTTINRMQDIFAFLDSVNDNQTLLDLLDAKMAYTSLVKNLTTNNDDLPLAASQGYALKTLVDSKEPKPFNVTSADITNITAQSSTTLYTVTLSPALLNVITSFNQSLYVNWETEFPTLTSIKASRLTPANKKIVSNNIWYCFNATGGETNFAVIFFLSNNTWYMQILNEELPTFVAIDSLITLKINSFLNSAAFENKVRAIVDAMYADVSEVEY